MMLYISRIKKHLYVFVILLDLKVIPFGLLLLLCTLFPSSDFIPLDFSGKVFNEAEAIIDFYVRFWFNLQVRILSFLMLQ
jgi:hypothetical protein